MSATIEKNKQGQEELVLRLPIAQNPQPSSTGKTLLVATHTGDTGVRINGKVLRGSGSFYIDNPSYVKNGK